MSYSVFRGFPVVGGWRVARRHLVTALAALAVAAAAAPKVEKFVAPEVLAEADGVWRLGEQGDAVEAARQGDALVRAADALREADRLEEAREYYRRAGLVRPWDFATKLRQADTLLRLGDSAGAREVAAPVARYVETDAELAECRRFTGAAEPAPLPRLADAPPAADEVVIALVATPTTERWLVQAVGRTLAAQLGARVTLAATDWPIGKPDRTGRVFLANELRRTLPWDDPRMGLVRLNGEQFKPENLNADQVIELMRTLLTREANAKGLEALAARVAAADKILQWSGPGLLPRLQADFPPPAQGRVVYLALLPVDLYAGRSGHVFGSAAGEGGYAVVSYNRFTAATTGEPARSARLAERTTKQLLSSLGFALGVPRCADPGCARSYPHSLAEHDAKGTGLCAACRAGLARALGHELPAAAE